jgi:hypothetical protein
MIDHLDNLLRHLFIAQIDEIINEDQVRFQPPDDNWRNYVSTLTVDGQPLNALNVYLVDLRENRKLRSNERVRSIDSGMISKEPVPRRIDCHYLITAWSPASITPAVEPTIDEHILLYKVIAVLMNNEPLVPRRIYEPNPLPPTFPQVIADAELPTTVLPMEGFPKLAEFWGTMGVNHRWKPAIYSVVTLPVSMEKEIEGPMVTSRITEYRLSGKAETAEIWIEIGGCVEAGLPPQPVAGAWVRLEDAGGTPLQTFTTDSAGRFRFGRLQKGNYVLRVRAQGFTEVTRNIEVPSVTGDYNVKL